MASAVRPMVYIATEVTGLAKAVRSILTAVDVKELYLTKTGSLSATDNDDISQNAEVLFADSTVITDVMYTNRKLKWAQSTWAGVEAFFQSLDHGKPLPEVTITRCGHGFGDLMAEYVLAYILSIERKLPQMFVDQQQFVWDKPKYNGQRSLSELRMGILGAGGIGTEIGKTCKALGMEVWGLTRKPRSQENDSRQLDVYKTVEELPEVLENCDYICSVLPDTLSTTDLLSGDVLSHCKNRKSVFINIGRGNVIDEESILKALRNGWIRYAVLDVFRAEPLPQDSKLWSHPNVYITPHISGTCRPGALISSTYDLSCCMDVNPLSVNVRKRCVSSCLPFKNLAEMFAKNYNKFINGESLDYVVNWKDGY